MLEIKAYFTSSTGSTVEVGVLHVAKVGLLIKTPAWGFDQTKVTPKEAKHLQEKALDSFERGDLTQEGFHYEPDLTVATRLLKVAKALHAKQPTEDTPFPEIDAYLEQAHEAVKALHLLKEEGFHDESFEPNLSQLSARYQSAQKLRDGEW